MRQLRENLDDIQLAKLMNGIVDLTGGGIFPPPGF